MVVLSESLADVSTMVGRMLAIYDWLDASYVLWRNLKAHVHQVAEGTAALMYTALLSSQGFTSVTVQVLRPAALENWRNDLRSDPVFAIATQCTSKEAVSRRVDLLYTA